MSDLEIMLFDTMRLSDQHGTESTSVGGGMRVWDGERMEPLPHLYCERDISTSGVGGRVRMDADREVEG